MEITRRCDYACRIIRAAYESGDRYVSVTEIAEKEQIPLAFARNIRSELVEAGYLQTIRGVRGGIKLSCDPAQVTLYDVLTAIQGPVGVSPCTIEDGYCSCRNTCQYNAVWRAADKLMNDLFKSLVLVDLFEKGADHPALRKVLGDVD